jgi:hypothetical protein
MVKLVIKIFANILDRVLIKGLLHQVTLNPQLKSIDILLVLITKARPGGRASTVLALCGC